MAQFLKNKTSYQIRIASLLLIFGILTVLGILEPFGFLKPLAQIQFWLFGYLGYIWLFVAAFFVYQVKDSFDFKNNRFLEKTLGVIIGVFALLVLQGLFFAHAGILGVAFNSVLSPLITHLGVFVLVLLCFAFSVVLYSGKSPKELGKIFVQDLKEDLRQSQVPTEKIIKSKKNLKNLASKIKAFFTPPSQMDKKDSKHSIFSLSPQEKDTQNTQNNPAQETSKHSSLFFTKAPSTPRALTLEELIEQSKNNPPPPTSAAFNFQDDTEEESQEMQETSESESHENFSKEQSFEAEIDELRQNVELPTREDNPLENYSKEQNEIPQIRIVSSKEAEQQGFNAMQFQLESMASLENFKRFEKSHLYPEEEPKEEVIRLIKKEEYTNTQNQVLQTPTPTFAQRETTLDFMEESRDFSTPQGNPISQDSIPAEATKPKPIKAYPKNLYAATPFSAYYDKDPVGTQDYLVQKSFHNGDSFRDLSHSKESQSDDEPSTIFYYDKIKSTHPIKPEEIQQISQELQSGKNSPSTHENAIPPQTEPAALNHIIKQVIQEFMESQNSPNALVSNRGLEESAQETTKENAESPKPQFQENQEHNGILDSARQKQPTESLGDLEKSQGIYEVVEKMQDAKEVLNYTPTFAANPLPTYGYRFDNEAGKDLEVESQARVNPTLQAVPPKVESSTSEVISLFNAPKTNKEMQNKEEQKESFETQSSQAESCVPFVQATTQESPQQTKDSELSRKLVLENKETLSILGVADIPQIVESQDFVLPKLEFLQAPKEERIEIDEGEIDRKINDLLSKLRMFKIEGDIVRTYSGPIVTTFEFRPSPNVKVSRILTLQDDLAMALRAKTIRIQAPVPGKDVVGIEIPNNQIETIYLREILENDLFANSTSPLTLALGKDIVGNPFVTDLKKLPHLLIAGTTGSGKSVGINAMILSLLYKNSPAQLKLIMIDPKMLEFSIYNDIPHLLTPVITQPKKAIIALDNTVKEMERRYTLMSEARIKNIEGYNQKAEIEGFEPFPYIVVIIDELADLMMSGGKEAEVSISRLAQMARASGIHLIVATQRPSVDVVTGLIKANLPSRISYKVGQKIDSKVILDSFGAESLLGRGDMLFTPPGGGIVRLHAPWSTETEIEKIVEFIKSQCPPQYDENFMPNEDEILGLRVEGETDELYEEAKRIILSDGKTSISYIQRRLGIGYNKAANIIEQMQARGFLSEPNSKGVREILGN